MALPLCQTSLRASRATLPSVSCVGRSCLLFQHTLHKAEFRTRAHLPLGPIDARGFYSAPSLLKNAWAALKQRQIEKLLPSLIFEDKLPSYVYLGQEVLWSQPNAIEAERRAAEIDRHLQAAARERPLGNVCFEELEDLDWSLLTAVRAASPEVSAVAQYLLKVPSKRFRPLLLYLVHRFLQCSAQREETPQARSAALPLVMVHVAELIHTASLMHDDVLDEAATRRGHPAAHSVFGNKKAVLGGDFVLARASSIAATAGSPEVCLRVSQTIESLVKGELVQAFSHTSDIAKAFETMLTKSYHKTASLMAETCACLALIGGHTREWVDWCHEVGASVGLAFQLYDDELDLVASTQALGKPANNDLRNGVITAPLLLAAVEHSQELLPVLKRKLQGEGDAELAAKKIRDSTALPRARLLSRLYIQHVLRLLEGVPQTNPEQKDAAADIASLLVWVLQRKSS
ncbi:prenyl transferase [Cyclospora cayetanensis]|uniref:Prenyl transferase n=1 Tax=Cyclospora cayetanensis TaxID=88456 RepID=A0A6P6S2T5_9EIME|nr:prenyl transferase [Cyclospora cayetanensis]